MKQYVVKRKGRNFIKKLEDALIVGDITNFPIKGRTQAIGKNKDGAIEYTILN